jgi:putative transposase
MRKSRFSEAQIIGMIKEQEAGMPTTEVCRRHGLSPASFYKFKSKSKYGGMNVSESYCQIWCLGFFGHAAIWSFCVVSIPSLNLTPVMTLVR